MRSSRVQFLMAVGFFSAATVLLVGGLYGVLRLAAPSEEGPPPNAAQQQKEAPPKARVVVATAAVERGQAIAPSMLRLVTMEGAPPANVFDDPAQVAGRVAVADLHPNQIVVRESVSAAKEAAGLAALVPPGMRAVAVRVNDEIAVGNFLRPGDRADLHIILDGRGDEAEARILMQDVEILSVGPRLGQPLAGDSSGKDKGGATRPSNLRDITILVTPKQANQIALVRSIAHYALALRNRGDRTSVADVPVRSADLRSGRSPQRVPKAALSRPVVPSTPPPAPLPPAPKKVPARKIEIIAGTKVHSIAMEKNGDGS